MTTRRIGFGGIYLILLLAQMLICNYLHLSYYITLSLLPALILCLPIHIGTVGAMCIAFVTGWAVDFFAEGLIGLNILALVPVAFSRRGILGLVFGGEIFARGEDPSPSKNGVGRMFLALLIAQSLFLAVYIWADSAGTRPLWFDICRFLASLPFGVLLSMLSADILTDR